MTSLDAAPGVTSTGQRRSPGGDGSGALLEVRNLVTVFERDGRPLRAVDGVSFSVEAGSCVAIVGESGAGKSAVVRSITGLLPRKGVGRSGTARFLGEDLLKLSDPEMRAYLGPRIGVLFQDPMSYLNPVISIGTQLTEHMRLHLGRSKASSDAAAVALLTSVGVADPERRMHQFPHELSGGTRQRIAIAMALACDPSLLIADEPTTALDATVQRQVIELLRSLQVARNLALILVTHDLRLAAEIADELIVMYAGQIVERGPADQVISSPGMPYTRALLDAIPALGADGSFAAIRGEAPDLSEVQTGCRFRDRCWAATDRCRTEPPLEPVPGTGRAIRCWYPGSTGPAPRLPSSVPATGSAPLPPAAGTLLDPLVRVESLGVEYRTPGSKRRLQAVTDVSFDIRRGETLAVVGESGCGKSTVAKAIMQIVDPTAGTITFDGTPLTGLRGEALRRLRPRLQMVYQDPLSSLNPLRSVADIVMEPLVVWGRGDAAQRRARANEVLRAVGLDPESFGRRRPHQLSGGQAQRVAIARAIVLDPELVVCDEPVSGLDVSMQAQVLNLLNDLRSRLGLTMMFISHDLAVVSRMGDRVIVMYLGRICEVGPAASIFGRPRHPYTAALLSSVRAATGDRDLRAIGDVPSPTDVPSGCRFRTRCPLAAPRCAEEEPQLVPTDDDTQVACHFPLAVEEPARPGPSRGA